MNEKLDFIAIGDTVIDAFIHLKDDQAHTTRGPANTHMLCMQFGTKIPFEFAVVVPAVGNSANAAVSAARLGLKPGLISSLGNDKHADECLEVFKKEGVATDFIKKQDGKSTNYHYVLWYKDDRTILIKHEEFAYSMPDVGSPKWLYLSSLGGNSLPFHHDIADYLEKHPTIKLAFQPGTFQISLGKDELAKLYQHTEVFFCNLEEARLILNTGGEGADLAKAMTTIGPKIAVVTDGPNGAFVCDGTDTWFMPVYPDPKPPYERTGAGDAFASTFVAALDIGKTPAEAIQWAPINSMSVVQKVGAQEGLLTREQLEQLLKDAPESYKVQKLS
jgi:ribokinase